MLTKFPLLNRYLAPVLLRRFQSTDWNDNRLIRAILRDSPRVEEYETTFRIADLTSVTGATGIFDVIEGKDPDYDEKLFDALAEVRLAAWARSEGYRDIQKLNIMPATPTLANAPTTTAHLLPTKACRDRGSLTALCWAS